jgi:3-methyl-2-oxobutanoate hydroxymethyltransferase
MMMVTRTTIHDLQKMKHAGQRFAMVTAYDAMSARLAEAAGLPALLVGDSLGMVVQGHETTIPVTLDEMIYHAKAVTRATRRALIIVDLPFMTYAISPEQALTTGARVMQKGGAGALKLEGGAHMTHTVQKLVERGLPVMAHIGLTPQFYHQLGGWRAQGKDSEAARRLYDDALSLEQAGAFAIVLEAMPASLAAAITARLHIPTIGIGAGPGCDGQVQVFHDLLGLLDASEEGATAGFAPRHAKQYVRLGAAIRAALAEYADEVGSGVFPGPAQTFDVEHITDQLGSKAGDDADR